MFVNRLIKVLDADVKSLEKAPRHATTSDKIGPFLFQTKTPFDPDISIGGVKGPAASWFLNALTNPRGQKSPWELEPQFFDFGWISDDEIKEESVTVAQGYEVGLINLPANVCWMEHSWIDKLGIECTSGYIYITIEGGILAAEIRRMSAAALLEHKETIAPGSTVTTLSHKELFVWDGIMLVLPHRASAKEYNAKVICNTMERAVEPNNLFDPLMSMLGRLDAGGVDKVHIPAPARLNRRREAKGLPWVVEYTEVKIRPSRATLGHSGPQPDGHASPRYHFRRGHVRHFENGEATWVRPTFVGDPGSGEVRHTYNVEK